MRKPPNTDTYREYKAEHLQELLQDAIDHINPDVMGMTRDQALTLAGSMKNSGFSRADFADVMSRSSRDKGTFAKQWDNIRGSGKHGTNTEGTIFEYAQACGWEWPTPEQDPKAGGRIQQKAKQTPPALPELVKPMPADFKLSLIFDSKDYTEKPGNVWEIRQREQTPTPTPEPITPQDMAGMITSGRTFSPTVYNKVQDGTKEDGKPKYKYAPIMQQIFVVDIDNDEPATDEDGRPIKGQKKRIAEPLTIENALKICEKNGIKPTFVYETFSSKAHRDDQEEPYIKFRLVFATDKPITVQDYGQKGLNSIIEYFIKLFGKAADTSTTDPARLIFGTDEKDRAHLYGNILDADKLVKRVFAPQPAEDPKQEEETALTAHTASDYLNNGIFEADINYFKAYAGRKMGLHKEIDRYLTLYPGLAVLGGASSLGKTTFICNMIDSLLRRGETVLYFSLEQLPIEIITKSLARRMYEKDPYTQLTNIQIKNGATSDALEAIKKEYAKTAGKYHIIRGDFRTTAADIVTYVEQYRKDNGGDACKPIVIIDYLQLIASPDGFKGGIREYTDENIKALKKMQLDNGLFVVMVSNFNRSSNLDPVSYESFKETSMIEFTCDFVWGLQLSILDPDKEGFYTKTGAKGGTSETTTHERRQKINKAQADTPKKVQFVSLKNRNGKQFFTALFNYYPQHDYFEEWITDPVFIPAETETVNLFDDLKKGKAL